MISTTFGCLISFIVAISLLSCTKKNRRIYLQDLGHNTIFSSDIRTKLKRKKATLLQNHIHATIVLIIAYYDRFKDLQIRITYKQKTPIYSNLFIYMECLKILVKLQIIINLHHQHTYLGHVLITNLNIIIHSNIGQKTNPKHVHAFVLLNTYLRANLFDHFVAENLISVENFDSGQISSDGVPCVFDLSEASFAQSSSHLVVPHSRPACRRCLLSTPAHFLLSSLMLRNSQYIRRNSRGFNVSDLKKTKQISTGRFFLPLYFQWIDGWWEYKRTSERGNRESGIHERYLGPTCKTLFSVPRPSRVWDLWTLSFLPMKLPSLFFLGCVL